MKKQVMDYISLDKYSVFDKNTIKCATSFNRELDNLKFISMSEKEIKELTGFEDTKAIIIDGCLYYDSSMTLQQLVIAAISEIINTTAGLSYVIYSDNKKDYVKKLKLISFAILSKLNIIQPDYTIAYYICGRVTGVLCNGRNDSLIDTQYEMIKNLEYVKYIQDVRPANFYKHIKSKYLNSEDVRVCEYMGIFRYTIPIRLYNISEKGLETFMGVDTAIYVKDDELIYHFDEMVRQFEECYKIFKKLGGSEI